MAKFKNEPVPAQVLKIVYDQLIEKLGTQERELQETIDSIPNVENTISSRISTMEEFLDYMEQ